MSHNVCHHGVSKAKGCQHLRLGHFDKLFPKLQARRVADPREEARVLGGIGGVMHDANDSSRDNGNLPAGYTFLAQFIDHDITLDTGSSLDEDQRSDEEVRKLGNIRSAALDLDCVYGFGPEANPHLYDGVARGRLLTGNDVNPNDLARSSAGVALIGDPRNDENLFVSQLQLLFLRFHNKVLDGLVGDDKVKDRFEEAQKRVRQHYQYLVVHDFLRRVCLPGVFQWAVKRATSGKGFPCFYGPDKHGNLPMPVEFSVAAYRFGHSLVRSRYAANGNYPDIDLFDEMFGTEGFSAIPPKLTVDWAFLLPVDQCVKELHSKLTDHLLADELIRLPNPVVGRRASADERSLAFRNLVRGHVLALPSGQDVAGALSAAGYPDIDPSLDLKLDKLVADAKLRKQLQKSAPLFFYVLREAGVTTTGKTLGPVGSAILLEVFLGILLNCEDSFIKDKGFKLDPCIAPDPKNFQLADIVRFVG